MGDFCKVVTGLGELSQLKKDNDRLLIAYGHDGCPHCKEEVRAINVDPLIQQFLRQNGIVPVYVNVYLPATMEIGAYLPFSAVPQTEAVMAGKRNKVFSGWRGTQDFIRQVRNSFDLPLRQMGSLDDWLKLAIQDLVIVYTSPACGPCHQLQTAYENDPHLDEELKVRGIDLIFVDASDFPDLVQNIGIEWTPQMHFYGKNGRIGKKDGFVSPKDLLFTIDELYASPS